MFAGTNNEVFIELIGESARSERIYIKPKKGELEVGSVDTYLIQIDRTIGIINELIVGKGNSKIFFSDWYLDKVGNKMIF